MYSIQECREREKIENDEEYTDEEIAEIRDDLYDFADITINTAPLCK